VTADEYHSLLEAGIVGPVELVGGVVMVGDCVRVFTILGGVTVKDGPPRRNLREMIRSRRRTRTGD
jgi:hypothetical protein